MIGAVLGLALAATQPSPTLYDQAVSARRAGRDEQAVSLLERTLETEPGNADVWVQYGFALRNVGRTAEARQAFERALALAPEYQDARDGLASLETVTTPPVILSVDGTLTNVRAARHWRDARIAVSIPMGTSAQRIELSIEDNKRFGRHDTYGELRFDHRVDDVTPRSRSAIVNSVASAGMGTPLIATNRSSSRRSERPCSRRETEATTGMLSSVRVRNPNSAAVGTLPKKSRALNQKLPAMTPKIMLAVMT